MHAGLLRLVRRAGKLGPSLAAIDTVIVRAFGGGEATGPNPADRRRPGAKHARRVDRHGVPMAIRAAGANVRDHRLLIPLVAASPGVGGKPGRPKELPGELYADRGFDSAATRRILAWRGIAPHTAKRNAPHGRGRGKVRWAVERTISWAKGLRRGRVRCDRLGVMQDAWASLAASVVGFRILSDEYQLAA